MRLILFNSRREPVAASEDPRAIRSAARLLGIAPKGNVAEVIDLSIYGRTVPVVRELTPLFLEALGIIDRPIWATLVDCAVANS